MTPTKKGFTLRGLAGENRPTLWLAPLLAVVTLFYLYPAFEVLRYSLTNASLLKPDYQYTLNTFARTLSDRLWAIGLGCLLGGVLGNLTDRVFRDPGFLRGHVVDFFQLPNWPVFNVADICINVAAAVIIVQAIRGVSHTGDRKAS